MKLAELLKLTSSTIKLEVKGFESGKMLIKGTRRGERKLRFPKYIPDWEVEYIETYVDQAGSPVLVIHVKG